MPDTFCAPLVCRSLWSHMNAIMLSFAECTGPRKRRKSDAHVLCNVFHKGVLCFNTKGEFFTDLSVVPFLVPVFSLSLSFPHGGLHHA
jgi:hypothetical protein